MKEFGQHLADVEYRPRPGAYGICISAAHRVAVVMTSKGYYLPGGGIDPGETPEQALQREAREECGWQIAVKEKLADAIQYVHAPGEGYFAKHCAFYRFEIINQNFSQPEPGHAIVWIGIGQAQSLLNHESQSWAIALATENSSLI